jgi:hypothetical protein
MHAPTNSHWDVVKRILRYLRGTVIYGISLTVPHLLYMVLQMQIGQIVLMIASLQVVILSSVGQTPVSWKSGKSIKLWQVALLRLSGFNIY